MNIVIMVIGLWGDIQLFFKIGKFFKDCYCYWICVVMYLVFKNFVQCLGFEFFFVGGDFLELMVFMVKNLGMIFLLQMVRVGEISK